MYSPWRLAGGPGPSTAGTGISRKHSGNRVEMQVGHHTGMDGSDRHRWEGHVIVCGLQGVGLRTVEQLPRAGVDGVVVDDEPDQRLARIVEAWDGPHIMGSPRIAGVL